MKTHTHATKRICLVFLLGILLFPAAFAEKVKLTLAINPLNPQEKYIVIDSDDPELNFKLTRELSYREDLQLFLQSSNFNEDRSALDNKTFDFPMVLGSNDFINKDDAVKDCIIGTGACLGGIIFVLVTGSSDQPVPNGFNAYVNDTYVTGGSAIFVAAIWTTGCIFGVKGIIELFNKRNSYKRTSAIPDEENQYLSTPELIKEGQLEKKSEWIVEVDAKKPINKDLISYFVHLLNV